MALIEGFAERSIERPRLHEPTRCRYAVVDVAGSRRLQLDTYGSRDRVELDKVSQSVQLDLDSARELIAIIYRVFPDLR